MYPSLRLEIKILLERWWSLYGVSGAITIKCYTPPGLALGAWQRTVRAIQVPTSSYRRALWVERRCSPGELVQLER